MSSKKDSRKIAESHEHGQDEAESLEESNRIQNESRTPPSGMGDGSKEANPEIVEQRKMHDEREENSKRRHEEAEKNAKDRHNEIEKNAKNRYWWLILLSIITVIVTIIQNSEYNIGRIFHNTVNYIHAPIKPWISETKIDIFDGEIRTSRILTITDGWDKKTIRLIARNYKNDNKRELMISGISEGDRICADDAGKLDIQIKMGAKVHAVPVKLSKNGMSLIFEHPEIWIKKLGNLRRFDVRVDDECGIRTDFTFKSKGVMMLTDP